MTLEIPTELEVRLREDAARDGLSADEYAMRLLEQHVRATQAQRNAAAIAALESFCEGDAEEQRETGEYLIRVLDEDRLSNRKLFPWSLR